MNTIVYGTLNHVVNLGSDGMHAAVMDTVIDLDVTIEEALDELVAESGVRYLVLNPEGPGGGWPVVLYVGPKTELEAFLIEHWNE